MLDAIYDFSILSSPLILDQKCALAQGNKLSNIITFDNSGYFFAD